jgi:enoyl-CoA hydratase
MMNYHNIRVEHEDALAIITIAREKALNALNSAVLAELSDAVAELDIDANVRVIALTGAGDKSFVAGADIGEMREMTPRQAAALAGRGGALAAAMERAATPFIAAVNGFALGGGCELALACDFIYASSRARFGQPEVKLGVIPGFGGTQRLTRRVGIAKAKELIFSGEIVPAEEALRIGLCDAVMSPEELLPRVREMARKIAAAAPLAVATAKRVVQEGASMSLDHGVLVEMHAFAGLFGTADQREGMAAFAEKRAPSFRGE